MNIVELGKQTIVFDPHSAAIEENFNPLLSQLGDVKQKYGQDYSFFNLFQQSEWAQDTVRDIDWKSVARIPHDPDPFYPELTQQYNEMMAGEHVFNDTTNFYAVFAALRDKGLMEFPLEGHASVNIWW